MNKNIALILLALAMSGCATWKHQTKLTGEGEMDLFYCKMETAKLACNIGFEGNASFLKKQVGKCMMQEHGWVKVKGYYIYPPRNYLVVSYLHRIDVWNPYIPCSKS